jgi:hypothetical protein
MSKKFAAFAFSLCVLASGVLPSALLAATPTASIGVTATVQAGCLISATSVPLARPLATLAMAKPRVSVTCTVATPYAVELTERERLAAAFGTLTYPASTVSDPAVARYPSVLKIDRLITADPFTSHMECCRTPSLRSIAAGASAHAITVMVTY